MGNPLIFMTRNGHLCHHGILGQKWGRVNGPPYPLDYDSHSSIEKKKNSISDLDGISDRDKSSNRKLKIGLAVAGALLVTAGGVYLYKTGRLDSFIDAGKSKVADLNGSVNTKSSITSGDKTFRIKIPPEKASQILINSNPNGGGNNCGCCVTEFFARLSGIDCKARTTFGDNGTGLTSINDVRSLWKGNTPNLRTDVKFNSLKGGNTAEKLRTYLGNEYKPGCKGYLELRNSNGGIGHFIGFVTNKDGSISFVDPQAGKMSGNRISALFKNAIPRGKFDMFSCFDINGLEMRTDRLHLFVDPR